MTAATAPFPELLAARLRASPSQPLVTAYDDATGERTELSVITYANWVAKTANLLTDELMLDAGDTVLLDLPNHWLVPVFLGAAWSAGLVVSTDPDAAADLVVCGPDTGAHLGRGVPVLASALLPFGVRFAEPVAAPVQDYGVLWPGQSDVFSPALPPGIEDPAWLAPDGGLCQGELLESARGLPEGARLITDQSPLADRGRTFLGPLVAGGSVVLVRHPDPGKWPAHRGNERATSVQRAAQPASW